MSVDSVISIAWDVLKWVVVPVKRQFGYVISSNSYAHDLQKEVEKLAYEAERIQNAIEVARNNLRHVYSHVNEWQGNAEKVLKEAGELLGEFAKASKSCCYGTLPDPNCRYQFSKKAKDKIELLLRLARECSEFRDVAFIDPAPGNVTAPTLARREGKDVVQSTTVTAPAPFARDGGVFKSRVSVIHKIMAILADNDNSVVGVYGMGGVGKSTLLKEVESRIREQRSFDIVAKADVSENPDIKRIQGEIGHWLGLRDIEKQENVSLRANLLRERLEDEGSTKQENGEARQKRKVLIILDNLWERLDLDKVGIPCGPDNKARGCKLLLTSRDQRVLRREMRCDRDFPLGELKEEEAKRLFEKMVGGKVEVELEPLVEEALRISVGLPFLILAISKLFIDTSYPECKDALKQIWSEETGDVINKTLRVSYDRIKSEEAKSLLRLCVAYGVSKPSLEYLVRYGVGLRLFGEDSSLEAARNRLSSLIGTLQASSLLLHDDEDTDGFKVHDLVRAFVTLIASRDYPLLVLKEKDKLVTEWSTDKLKSCRAICFPYVDMKEFPEQIDCPELQIFLLFANNESLDVPGSYFNFMRKLMVLNLTGIHLIHSPLSFQLLENLHTLCLDGCSLEDVASLGNLKGLQILSFVNSKIHRLPKEIGQLVELNNCSRLQVIEPGVLGSLIKLEELYMENSFDKWNAMEQTPPCNACLIELNNMKNLCTLHVSIPDPNVRI